MRRAILTFASLILAINIETAQPAGAVTIDYFVFVPSPTGQTATADFSFVDSTTLRIALAETTPAGDSALEGSLAILTAIAFKLPDAVVITGSGHSVVIAAGSESVGFDPQGAPPPIELGGGDDVSGEWGATIGGEVDFDGSGSALGDERFDFVSTIGSNDVAQFPGTNHDGPSGLDGPQGGMLDEQAARGGAGIVDNALIFTLILDADPSTGGNQGLSASQQTAFLDSLETDSRVMYSSHGSFGKPVPEPEALVLVALGLGGLAFAGRERRPRPT